MNTRQINSQLVRPTTVTFTPTTTARTLTAAMVGGSASVTFDSSTGVNLGSVVGITKNNGSLNYTFLIAFVSGTTWTMASNWPSGAPNAASSGNAVTVWPTAATNVSWVVPANVSAITVTAVGGGAGGAGGWTDATGGGGGGGGSAAILRNVLVLVTSGETLTVRVGNPGCGGIIGAAPLQAPVSSYLLRGTSLITPQAGANSTTGGVAPAAQPGQAVNGGDGGCGGPHWSTALGGAGGTASAAGQKGLPGYQLGAVYHTGAGGGGGGSNTFAPGSSGDNDFPYTSGGIVAGGGGGGAPTLFGLGGVGGASPNAAGSNAPITSYGAGGGGGGSNAPGGNGAPGLIIVQY